MNRSSLHEEELSEGFADGDWSRNAWFLNEEQRWFIDAGMPLSVRARAAVQLRKLFPPDVCRELLKRPWHGGHVYFLFQKWLPWFIAHLIDAALDLEVVDAWSDPKLIADLRRREHFDQAAAELRIWANLRRCGYDVDREPVTSGGKRPDFCIYADYRRYFLEVKTYQESDLELLNDYFFSRLRIEDRFIVRGCVTRLRLAPPYDVEVLSKTGRDQIWRARDDVTGDIFTALNSITIPPVAGQTVAVGRYASLSQLPDATYADGAWDANLVPETPPDAEARRVLREIREARDQLPRDGTGFILVNVPAEIDPELVRTSLGSELRRSGADEWRHVALVLLSAVVEDEEGVVQRAIAPIRMPWHRPSKGEHRLFLDVLGEHRRLVLRAPRIMRRPVRGFWRRPRGRPVTVPLGRMTSASAGQSFTFTIGGGRTS